MQAAKAGWEAGPGSILGRAVATPPRFATVRGVGGERGTIGSGGRSIRVMHAHEGPAATVGRRRPPTRGPRRLARPSVPYLETLAPWRGYLDAPARNFGGARRCVHLW